VVQHTSSRFTTRQGHDRCSRCARLRKASAGHVRHTSRRARAGRRSRPVTGVCSLRQHAPARSER
jgi:hypothetical protein